MKKLFLKHKNLIISFIKFCCVGVINTLTSLIAYYILVHFSIDYIIANTVGFIVGTFTGFTLNKLFVFKNKGKTYSSLIKFYVTYITSYLFSTVLLILWIDVLNISDLIAPLINLCFTIPFNFIMSKIWVFKEKKIKYEPNHTFVICTYKESQFLEDCIKSVLNQTIKSKVIVATSTPNNYIKDIVSKYNLDLYVNTGKTGIQEDWNFAVSCCETDFVTVCHHDDIYGERYYEYIKGVIESPIAKKTLVIHTGYYDIDQNNNKSLTKNNKIKRKILFVSKCYIGQNFKLFKKYSLAFGNTVCCPSCTYNKKLLGDNFFNSEFTHCCDWDLYYKMAEMKGRMVYISEKLMSKRYHTGSQTFEDIQSGKRYKEDCAMFSKFWPKWIVNKMMKKYVKAYDINK